MNGLAALLPYRTYRRRPTEDCQECGRRLSRGGPYGDGLFCSQRCGYAWAVRTVRALLDASDEAGSDE